MAIAVAGLLAVEGETAIVGANAWTFRFPAFLRL
jgi:hypothetical protein